MRIFKFGGASVKDADVHFGFDPQKDFDAFASFIIKMHSLLFAS
jgi:hypothetical protein